MHQSHTKTPKNHASRWKKRETSTPAKGSGATLGVSGYANEEVLTLQIEVKKHKNNR